MERIILAILVALTTIAHSFAQSTLTGKVISPEGAPIENAHIKALNQDAFTISGQDGSFILNTNSPVEAISFSHVSFQPKAIVVSGMAEPITIILEKKINQLNEFAVGFETRKPLKKTAASIGILKPKDLARFDNNSLLPAINTIPGVRMEERSPGSYRLSIRGSLIRSPFGVRNVKVYYNGLPLTDATGNTPLNLIDFFSVGGIEVIKGPAGSMYGAGNGGIVLLKSKAPEPGEKYLESSYLAGSYGLSAYNILGAFAGEKSINTIHYSKRQSDGYRAHSAMQREMFSWGSKIKAGENQEIAINAFYSDLHYQIPGAITRDAVALNPRAARQGSKEQNSSIHLKTFNLGSTYTFEKNKISHSTSLFANNTAFNNPFIFDYKRNAEQGYGIRSVSSYKGNLGETKSVLSAGAEIIKGFASARIYSNHQGKPGDLRIDDELETQNISLFSQLELEFKSGLILTMGGSYNTINYQITRLSSFANNNEYFINKAFAPVFSPRVSALKTLKKNISAHASISYGYSPPTLAEIRTSEGSLNTAIEPEIGLNYESGLRGAVFKEQIIYDFSFFSMGLQNTISSYTSEQGVVLFRNAGSTRQNGIETSIRYEPANQKQKTIGYSLFASYTFSDFRYSSFTVNDKSFDRNFLPGISPHVLVSGLDVSVKPGFYLNNTLTYTSSMPLNDSNISYAESFLLLNCRAGFKRKIKNLSFDVFAGINNLLNAQYSLGNDLNAPMERFYQPAPFRNLFSGIKIQYHL
jgi:iron complex outermembrane recepter protein